MKKLFVLAPITLLVMLTAGAWGDGFQPFVSVPTPSTEFQHPYEYTPPPVVFANPPWTSPVKADPDSSASNPLDGAIAVTGQGKVIIQYNYLPVGTSTWPWRFNNTTNAGVTWTAVTLLASGTQFDNVCGGNKRDSCVALVMKQVGSGYNFYIKRSTNSGVSWQDTIHVPQAATGTFPDHPIMGYRHPNILVTYFNYGGNNYEGVARSTNWGTTWNTSQIYVSSASSQGGCPAFAPAPSTMAYATWGQPASWQPTTIWFNRSSDLGATWGTPRQILALSMSSHLPSMRPTHTFPAMVVAPNGTLYLTVMHMMQGNGWDIAFMKSTDQGTTWSTPVRVNDDVSTPNADQYDNWIAVDHLNRPHIFWTDNRAYYSSNIYAADIYYSYSTNGGTTWAANERINDVSPICNTSGDLSRMGDYQQIDCDSTRVYVQYTDPNAGHTAAYQMFSCRLLPSGVEENPTGNPWVNRRVDGIELAPSRPNPVMNGTELAFSLEQPAQASLKVYDLAGRLVRTLVDGPLATGAHSAKWDARDNAGKPVPSGVYFYRLQSGGLTATKELVVTR